ncbi:MAG: hypothetical protein LJE83_14185 [Gammaproteobacteria bacterium]|nr:hypothetical protein [Gammaproteobacteria bacterium]
MCNPERLLYSIISRILTIKVAEATDAETWRSKDYRLNSPPGYDSNVHNSITHE